MATTRHGLTAPKGFGFSTLAFLYDLPLEETFTLIAEAGYTEIELAPVEPHLLTTTASEAELQRLAGALSATGLTCRSVNPLDLNLVSPNTEIREFAMRHYEASVRAAGYLGAEIVNCVPGRISPLRPMPEADVMALLESQIAELLKLTGAAGLTLTMETAPFGFVETTAAVSSFVRSIGDPTFGVALDCANVYFIGEDPAEAVDVAGDLIKYVHVSDSTRKRWAHGSPGTGEIDFAAFHAALERIEYDGPVLYELIDRGDPQPYLVADREQLEEAGWRW